MRASSALWRSLTTNFPAISFYRFRGLQTNIVGLDKAHGGLNIALSFYAKRPEYLQRLNRELSRLDLGLEEMKIHPGEHGPIATFKHFGLDCDIVLAQESAGTRRFIEIFPFLQFVLDTGGWP